MSGSIRLLTVDPHQSYWIKDLSIIDEPFMHNEETYSVCKLGTSHKTVTMPMIQKSTGKVVVTSFSESVWAQITKWLEMVAMKRRQRKKAEAFKHHRRSILAQRRKL
jgi:hypothetical protein